MIPGQKFSIGATAVGQRKGTVPISSVNFEFDDVQYKNNQLIINNTFQTKELRTHCNILDTIVYSNQTRAVFKLTVQQVNPIEISYVHYEPPHLIILIIEECPWGFILSNSPPYKCVCDDLLIISCTIDTVTQTVTVPGRHYYW